MLAWQLLTGATVFVLTGALYSLTIYMTSGRATSEWQPTIINFSLKGILSLPVYWLLFVKFAKVPIGKRLFIHLATAPAYVGCWLIAYHFVCRIFGYGYLQGNAIWWDVFIPLLLYLIQFGIIHAYDYYRRLELKLESEKELQHLVHQGELNALKAQIQPHFLFNTLNSISASLPAAAEHGREMIARLADTFRYSMRSIESDLIPLQEELNFIKDCLELESERFRDRLHYTIDVDTDLASLRIPPMLLHPLVENAVKHGIAGKVGGGEIRLHIYQTDGLVHFEVIDTGAGFRIPPDESLFARGIGLRNVRARLRGLYQVELTIQPHIPAGARIRFAIPKKALMV